MKILSRVCAWDKFWFHYQILVVHTLSQSMSSVAYLVTSTLVLKTQSVTIILCLKDVARQSWQATCVLKTVLNNHDNHSVLWKLVWTIMTIFVFGFELVSTIMTIFLVSKTHSNNHDNLFCFKNSFNNHDNLFCEQTLFSHNHNNRFCEQNLFLPRFSIDFVSSTRHLNYVTSINTWHDCNYFFILFWHKSELSDF